MTEIIYVSRAPGRTIVEKVSGVARWAKRGGAPPVAATKRERGVQRLRQLWDSHGTNQLQKVKDGMDLSFFLKVSSHPSRGPYIFEGSDSFVHFSHIDVKSLLSEDKENKVRFGQLDRPSSV